MTAARKQRKHRQPRSRKSAGRRDKSSGGNVWHQQYDAFAPQEKELAQRAQVTSCAPVLTARGTFVIVFSASPDAEFPLAIGCNPVASDALVALMSVLRSGESRSDFDLQALLHWG